VRPTDRTSDSADLKNEHQPIKTKTRD